MLILTWDSERYQTEEILGRDLLFPFIVVKHTKHDIHHFIACDLVAFGTFMKLHSYHHRPVQGIFIPPKGNLRFLKPSLLIPLPQPLAASNLLSASMDLLFWMFI